MTYTFSTELNLPIDEVIERISYALIEEGLGLVSDINIQSIMTSKFQEEFRPYRILGACAPGLAKSLIGLDLTIGALLPCNIVVQEIAGRTKVSFMDPVAVLGMANQSGINDIARQVHKSLEKVQKRIQN
jgi:uncharacterized protein (DUF302 family)